MPAAPACRHPTRPTRPACVQRKMGQDMLRQVKQEANKAMDAKLKTVKNQMKVGELWHLLAGTGSGGCCSVCSGHVWCM